MIYLVAAILSGVNLVWLLATLVMLPGNWLMVACAAGVAWWQRDAGMFSPWTLAVAGGLALAGEIIEFAASAAGVGKAGGSRWGGVGALAGALLGLALGAVLVPVPVVGPLIGACCGAAAGALVGEVAFGKGVRQAFRPSLAAGAGRLAGTVLKFAVGVLIWTILTVAAFWP